MTRLFGPNEPPYAALRPAKRNGFYKEAMPRPSQSKHPKDGTKTPIPRLKTMGGRDKTN